MIDEGMLTSTLLRQAQHIWKVTGRHKVLNMAALINNAPYTYEIYADLRSVPLDWRHTWRQSLDGFASIFFLFNSL